jgi:hypothetical protein
MAVSLYIGGVQKAYRVGSLSRSATINGRTTLTFDVRSNDGTYRPARDEEVRLYRDATLIAAGLVQKPTEKGVLGDKTGDYPAISTRVSAVDFNHYAERRAVVLTIGEGTTLGAALAQLVVFLAQYGVTLDPAQPTGPALPALEYEYVNCGEVLNEWATLTGKDGAVPYAWRISDTKVLSMKQPASVPAPFNITEANKFAIGDVTVEETTDQFANRIILKVPEHTEVGRTESWVGDGVTTTFQLTYEVTWSQGYVVQELSETQREELGLPGDEASPTWTYDPEANTLTNNDGAPAAGTPINYTFNGVFKGFAIAEDGASISRRGLTERVIKYTEKVQQNETAQTLADAALAKALQIPQTIRYVTRQHGLEPGMSQTIQSTKRNLNVTATITEVVTKDRGTDGLEYAVTAVSGTEPKDRWRDVYKHWSRIGTGASTDVAPVIPSTITTAGIGMIGPAPPRRSIQFNRFDKFGGREELLFDEDTVTVMIGTDHTEAGLNNLLLGETHTLSDEDA